MHALSGGLICMYVCSVGCDPSHEQWDQISALMKAKNHVALMDCAYQVRHTVFYSSR